MRAAVLINKNGGTASEKATDAGFVRAAFRAVQVEADVHVVIGSELAALARVAVQERYDAVVAGGGDGTVSTVAGVLAGSGIPLGVLPLGTANHFARDLQIPLDFDGAVRVVARGAVRTLDVGEVNGRIFINNSLLGFYPSVVEVREKIRKQLGLVKYFATALAAALVWPRFPMLTLHLSSDGRTVSRRTPFVFIGNNAYRMHLFRFEARPRLSSELLFVYLSRCTDRFCLMRYGLLALFKDLNQEGAFERWDVAEVQFDTSHRPVRVFADGELFSMTPPLRYRCHPHALHVIHPADEHADGAA